MKKGRYHHGELRAALVDAAIDLISEHGIRGFSLAEASRRLGVTVAAPYKHFADRDALLAEVAVRASEVLAATVTAQSAGATDPAAQLAAVACGYVRCAATNRALFQALFGADLDKARHPEIDVAAGPVAEAFLVPARALCAEDARAAATTTAGARAVNADLGADTINTNANAADPNAAGPNAATIATIADATADTDTAADAVEADAAAAVDVAAAAAEAAIDAAAHDLTLAVVAVAHGHATLLLDGAFGRGQDAVELATRRAAAVTHAVIQGRAAIRGTADPSGPGSVRPTTTPLEMPHAG